MPGKICRQAQMGQNLQRGAATGVDIVRRRYWRHEVLGIEIADACGIPSICKVQYCQFEGGKLSNHEFHLAIWRKPIEMYIILKIALNLWDSLQPFLHGYAMFIHGLLSPLLNYPSWRAVTIPGKLDIN